MAGGGEAGMGLGLEVVGGRAGGWVGKGLDRGKRGGQPVLSYGCFFWGGLWAANEWVPVQGFHGDTGGG